jgi:hypothetical protein
MESGCGRNEYFSGGMAWATATDNLLSAAKCLKYSPAASGGAAAAFAARNKIVIRTEKERIHETKQFYFARTAHAVG